MLSPLRSLLLLTVFPALCIPGCLSQNSSTPAEVFTITPTSVPTHITTATFTPESTSLFCEKYIEPDLDYEYYDFPSFLNAITRNLSYCASPATIIDDLRYIEKQGFAFTTDLNQDSVKEIIAGGVMELLPPPGQGWIDHEVNLVVFYRDITEYKAEVMFQGSFNGYPELSGITDVNKDGTNEVVFTIPYGGSGCDEIVSIIGWQNNRPIDYFEGVERFVDCPATAEVVDIDHDGFMEVIAKHRGSNLNPGSPIELVYRFDPVLKLYLVVP